jgi:D-aminopeptidase
MSTTRARDLGIPFGGQPGGWNAITDVPGLTVGYTTLIGGHGPLVRGGGPIRSGVTAILPRGRAGVGIACAAGSFSMNGNGEMTGLAWVEESGSLAQPILVTSTHAVGACHHGAVQWVADHHPLVAAKWLLPLVAETWDGYLHDINGAHVTAGHAIAALEDAHTGPLAEGSVGGGTGMNCFGFKGGSGTSSRLVQYAGSTYTVGVFVQANFGSRHELTIAGVPFGTTLADDNPMETTDWFGLDARRAAPGGAGSVIVIVATDAPLLPGQCKAMARRVPLGLARTGTCGSHFSGDIFLALSTANEGALTSDFTRADESTGNDAYETLRFVPWGEIDRFFEALVPAVEEAVVNALVANHTLTDREMIGRDGNRSPALPIERVVTALGGTDNNEQQRGER